MKLKWWALLGIEPSLCDFSGCLCDFSGCLCDFSGCLCDFSGCLCDFSGCKVRGLYHTTFNAIRCCDAVVFEVFVAQWCNPLTLQSEQLGRQGSIPSRAPPLERHDKGLLTQSALTKHWDHKLPL